MPFAASITITPNPFANTYNAFQFIIPSLHYSSELFSTQKRLQKIPVASGITECYLIGYEYQYGVEFKKDQVTDTYLLDFTKLGKTYLFGQGQQICSVEVTGLLPVEKVHDPIAYDLDTLDGHLVILKDQRKVDVSDLKTSVIEYLNSKKNKLEWIKSDDIVTHRVEKYIERDIEMIMNSSSNIQEVKEFVMHCDDVTHVEVQVRLSAAKDMIHPTTDEIMTIFQGFASHQFQHTINHLQRHIMQDLECIHKVASSFLNRDQSAETLYDLIQRTKETTLKLVKVLESLEKQVKEQLHVKLKESFLESIQNLHYLSRMNFVNVKCVQDLYDLILENVKRAMFTLEQLIPISYVIDLAYPQVMDLLSIIIATIQKSIHDTPIDKLSTLLDHYEQYGFLVPIYPNGVLVSQEALRIIRNIHIQFHAETMENNVIVSKIGMNWCFSLPLNDGLETKPIQLLPCIITEQPEPLVKKWLYQLAKKANVKSDFEKSLVEWCQLLKLKLKIPLIALYFHQETVIDFSELEYELLALHRVMVQP